MRPDPEWPAARAVALTRDLGRCGICGQDAVEVNHRVPRQMGGRNADPDRHAPERLVSCCRACHDLYERQQRTRGYDIGFFVRAGQPAHLTPILYRGRWALLTTLGTIDWLPPQGRTPRLRG